MLGKCGPNPDSRLYEPSELVMHARTWIDVPFRHQGRNRQGIDCAGLILDIAHHFSIFELVVEGYRRSSDPKKFLRYFDDNFIKIPKDQAEPGCVATFRDNTQPGHTCIFGSNAQGQLTMIHAYGHPRVRKVVENDFNADWVGKVISIYQYHKVNYTYGQ